MYNGIVEKCRGPSGQPDGSSFYGGMPMKNPFSGLFRARDKPQDSVSAAPVCYFGTSGSGKFVTVPPDTETVLLSGFLTRGQFDAAEEEVFYELFHHVLNGD